MRYHVVVYLVPNPSTIDETVVIEEEFDSDLPADDALIEWAQNEKERLNDDIL